MRDSRSPKATASHRLYSTARWKRLRERQLTIEPLCRFCQEAEVIEVATVADHIVPHGGDEARFYDPDNLQSLCAACHNSTKQRMELGQDVVTFGADGWPRGAS
jgi:5-methylcytosine-specific restriction endonuclease McrA